MFSAILGILQKKSNPSLPVDYHYVLTVMCRWLVSPQGGIIVTENGTAVDEPTVEAAVDDKDRIAYFEAYIAAMHEAMEQGADVP